MDKKQITQIVIPTIVLFLGVLIGMEYKAYQIRSAMSEAFEGFSEEMNEVFNKPNKEIKKEDKQKTKAVKKTFTDIKIGNEIELETMKISIMNSAESSKIDNEDDFYEAHQAKDGAKFISINLEITNTTKDAIFFDFDREDLKITDNQERNFTYKSFSFLDDSFDNFTELIPSITENGYIYFEIPQDSEGYSLIINKDYKIQLN